MRQLQAWLFVFLKGMLMGAADVVPGVSGGTIAFITGIYQRLLAALASLSWSLIGEFRKSGFRAVWQSVDGTFLAVLLTGILVSIVSFAKLISWLLEFYSEPLWALFFGLILSSAWLLVVDIQRSHRQRQTGLLLMVAMIGAIFALLLTLAVPVEVEPTALALFVGGSIAICAMILPGISGSFILLLMGLYSPVLMAIKNFEFQLLAFFMSGCLVGILSFSKLLNWLYGRYSAVVSALLVGVMIGSLNKVWPWKQTLTFRVNSHGEEVPLIQRNVLPFDYFDLTGNDPHLGLVLFLLLSGLFVVLFLHKVTANDGQTNR